MITLVITACGRLDLLKRTIDSFNKYNNYPIYKRIIVDDSGDEKVHEELKKNYQGYHLILNPKNRGLIKCIDDAYSQAETELLFHLEEDWEFVIGGFIELSYKILAHMPKIMQVWLRGVDNPNGHPIEDKTWNTDGVEFRYVAENYQGIWHGFSFNPGLRRLKDYEDIAPYDSIRRDGYEGDNIAIRENHIGRVYHEKGYRAVTLLDEYCIHTGGGKSARK